MPDELIVKAELICRDLRAKEFAYKDYPNAGSDVDISSMAKDSADVIEGLISTIDELNDYIRYKGD